MTTAKKTNLTQRHQKNLAKKYLSKDGIISNKLIELIESRMTEGNIPAKDFPNGNVEARNEKCIEYSGNSCSGYPVYSGIKIVRILMSYYKNNKQFIETKEVVRHMCENRACINMNHLELGTARENVEDRVFHKTARVIRKLTDDEAVEIRNLYATGNYYHSDIAEMYGVKRKTISDVCIGKSFKDVEGPITITRKEDSDGSRSKIKTSDIRRIRELADQRQLTYAEIAKLHDCTVQYVSKIVKRYMFKDV